MRVVALHGFLGHSSDFAGLQKSLDRRISRYHFWAPNLFSSDDADYLPQKMSSWATSFLRQHIQEVPFSLKALPSSPRILIGYSFGGRLALELFSERPEIWDHVFLVSANPGFLRDHERSDRLLSDANWAERFRDEKWSEVLAAWNDQSIFKGTHEPSRFEGDFSRENLALALEKYSLAQMSVTKEKLRQEKEKMKWVAGERDSKLTTLYADLKNDGVIQNLEIIKDSGHRVLFDQPDLIADLVVRAAKL